MVPWHSNIGSEELYMYIHLYINNYELYVLFAQNYQNDNNGTVAISVTCCQFLQCAWFKIIILFGQSLSPKGMLFCRYATWVCY